MSFDRYRQRCKSKFDNGAAGNIVTSTRNLLVYGLGHNSWYLCETLYKMYKKKVN